jgi:DeoR family transcriptional regulator, fructose operon transcriptional repressor
MSDVKRKLLSPERENMILQALGEGIQTITELSKKLNVSEATVRRDLQSLELQGKAKRVHGGAVRTKFPRTEPIFAEKAAFQADEKQSIAAKALAFIDDDDTIFLDGGSTVLGLTKLLEGKKNLTIVTNSLMAAAELMESGHQLIMVGGEFRPLSRTVVGPLTARSIEPLSISKAFLGTIGFSVEDGISTTAPSEAYTKELIMRKAAKVIVMSDSSKIGTPSLVTSGSIDDIDVLITDSGISEKAIKQLQKKKIEVVF